MPASVPTTARIPASVMNIALRFADRGDGSSGPTRSRPPVIDLANNRLTFRFIVPIALKPYRRKFHSGAGLHRRHGSPPASNRPRIALGAGFAALLWHGSQGRRSVLGS